MDARNRASPLGEPVGPSSHGLSGVHTQGSRLTTEIAEITEVSIK